MKITIVSDTHGQPEALGELKGDLLIHCGDFCYDQSRAHEDLESLDRWFSRQQFRLIACTGGNHDFLVEERTTRTKQPFRHAVYLQGSGASLDGLKIYGALGAGALALSALQERRRAGRAVGAHPRGHGHPRDAHAALRHARHELARPAMRVQGAPVAPRRAAAAGALLRPHPRECRLDGAERDDVCQRLARRSQLQARTAPGHPRRPLSTAASAD